jgi:hypothetical protein
MEMTRTAQIDRTEKELDFRASDGIEVRLFWCPGADHLIVEVVDTKAGDAFRLEIAPGQAREAFEHPYAYAATRGVEYVEPRRLRAKPVSA